MKKKALCQVFKGPLILACCLPVFFIFPCPLLAESIQAKSQNLPESSYYGVPVSKLLKEFAQIISKSTQAKTKKSPQKKPTSGIDLSPAVLKFQHDLKFPKIFAGDWGKNKNISVQFYPKDPSNPLKGELKFTFKKVAKYQVSYCYQSNEGKKYAMGFEWNIKNSPGTLSLQRIELIRSSEGLYALAWPKAFLSKQNIDFKVSIKDVGNENHWLWSLLNKLLDVSMNQLETPLESLLPDLEIDGLGIWVKPGQAEFLKRISLDKFQLIQFPSWEAAELKELACSG